MSAPYLRPAVRALMIDPADRVLMIRLKFDDWTGWVLPGGGIEPGEDHSTALRRELAEETGVPETFIGPQVWLRRHLSPHVASAYDGQEEAVYLVPCNSFDVAPSMTPEELRSEGIVEHRWWSVSEMANTDDVLRPPGLHEHVGRILEFGAPAEPMLLEEGPES
ncbi:MAG: NUDIX hydrolase [Acidimicrobiales bacterium]